MNAESQIKSGVKQALGTVGLRKPAVQAWKNLGRRLGPWRPPEHSGARLTPKRLLNYWRVQRDLRNTTTVVSGYPVVLTIEAANACNLRCPHCFTGAGEVGRDKGMLQMPLYEKLLDELGDYLFNIEFYNWGEPLLNKRLEDMIAMATRRGISTYISTNFSVPFDDARAERIVAAGLDLLGVSLDGATQESYEQYRVRGDFNLVLDNVRKINAAKKKLGSAKPEVAWEFHLFPHNLHELDRARDMARELRMTFMPSKGWVTGADWDTEGKYADPPPGRAAPCYFLWQRAVVNIDGGVAPCCSTFYTEDDYGVIDVQPERQDGQIALGSLHYSSFRELWNNESFQRSRAMFANRDATPEGDRAMVCYDCPITVTYDAIQKHRRAGQPMSTFQQPFGPNDGFNYFLTRKPARAQKPAEPQPLELMETPPALRHT